VIYDDRGEPLNKWINKRLEVKVKKRVRAKGIVASETGFPVMNSVY